MTLTLEQQRADGMEIVKPRIETVKPLKPLDPRFGGKLDKVINGDISLLARGPLGRIGRASSDLRFLLFGFATQSDGKIIPQNRRRADMPMLDEYPLDSHAHVDGAHDGEDHLARWILTRGTVRATVMRATAQSPAFGAEYFSYEEDGLNAVGPYVEGAAQTIVAEPGMELYFMISGHNRRAHLFETLSDTREATTEVFRIPAEGFESKL